MSDPTIVVIAYNREHSLKRLLASIAQANYPSKHITLHISIDASDNPKVEELAHAFEWNFGEKIIDVKSERHGLLRHVLECGQLTATYGSIVVVEDDLIVAPNFYQFAKESTAFYSDDDKIGGISLYSYSCEENNYLPFQPLNDGSDVHFIQVASSWGQAWTNHQWSNFTNWLTQHPSGKEAILPNYVRNWGSNSWKKLFISYLIDTDRYFAFPNVAYSSNFEDEGTHAIKTGLLQVPLNMGEPQTRFKKWEDSNLVYDAFFELKEDRLKRLNPAFEPYSFVVDFYGERDDEHTQTDYVLTSRRGKNPVLAFGAEMKPLLQNVLFNLEGTELGLYKKEEVLPTENCRFLKLVAGASSVQVYAQVHEESRKHVSVVFPVLEGQVEALKRTFKTIPTDRFHEISMLLVCESSVMEHVHDVIVNSSLNVTVIPAFSSDQDALLRLGIAHCKTEYCTWAQPGMRVDVERLLDASRIFQSFKQIQAFRGSSSEVNSVDSNTGVAHLRWTAQLALLRKQQFREMRTEWIFWRKELFSTDEINELTTTNLYAHLLKKTLVYAVALEFGGYNAVDRLSVLSVEELVDCLSEQHFQPKFGLKSLVRPIFSFWFYRNVRFFRLFYRELEQLPLVVRFDMKHNSFYLENY